MTYANLIGLKPKMNGYGYVTSQSVAANTKYTKDLEIEITLNKWNANFSVFLIWIYDIIDLYTRRIL